MAGTPTTTTTRQTPTVVPIGDAPTTIQVLVAAPVRRLAPGHRLGRRAAPPVRLARRVLPVAPPALAVARLADRPAAVLSGDRPPARLGVAQVLARLVAAAAPLAPRQVARRVRLAAAAEPPRLVVRVRLARLAAVHPGLVQHRGRVARLALGRPGLAVPRVRLAARPLAAALRSAGRPAGLAAGRLLGVPPVGLVAVAPRSAGVASGDDDKTITMLKRTMG